MSRREALAADARVAVVLAASKGVGRGCAEAAARRGMRVVLAARGEDGVAGAVRALRDAGGEATGVAADVTSPDGLAAVLAQADEAYGRLDGLVVNAGGPPASTFLDTDEDGWRVGFEGTLLSAVRAIHAALPRMRTGGGGRIVVIGSSSSRLPLPGLALSNAYRPALVGVVKTAAVELAGGGITVNMVSPGRIDTDRVRSLDEARARDAGTSVEEARAASVASIPAGRYGTPAEIGELVAFLLSAEAGYITGQNILVDGALVPTLP